MSTIVELEVKLKNAMAALGVYSDEIVAKYRQEYPGPAMAFKRRTAWTEDERAELARLRGAAREAMINLHDARQGAQRSLTSPSTSGSSRRARDEERQGHPRIAA